MIYLDNSATTKADLAVIEKTVSMMDGGFGNPSSLHGKGSQAYQELGIARNRIAKMLGAHTSGIYFTSGATESNNLAIQGGARANLAVGRHIVTTAIEHDSVLEACRHMETQGWDVTYVKPDQHDHCIHAESVISAVREDTSLVSAMFVNNETGEILPLKDMIRGIRQKNPGTYIHCDCVQGFGKLSFKLHEYDVDMVSVSGHKIHGPQGIGALYLRSPDMVVPLVYGGKQESGISPGTENLPGACGFGLASDIALYKMRDHYRHVEEIRNYLAALLKKQFPQAVINSPQNSSPYILNFSIPGKNSDQLVRELSIKEIYVSAGSACSKGKPSHVLKAMGIGKKEIHSALRVGLSKFTTKEEIEELVKSCR